MSETTGLITVVVAAFLTVTVLTVVSVSANRHNRAICAENDGSWINGHCFRLDQFQDEQLLLHSLGSDQ